MRTSEPYTVTGNRAGPSASSGRDPVSRRAALAAKARNHPKEQFNNLLHHLTYELVDECLNKIPRASAVGIDGMSVEEARQNLSWLLPPILKQIHAGQYAPPAVRRVYIPKADGKQRPIGIPAVVDRAIQAAMAAILNEIYEQDFLKCSFGFRPGLSCHHALATINEILYRRKAEYVLEVDIQDFFGSLNHEWLKRFLGLRIGDKRVLKLIDAWLKAGVMAEGNLLATAAGTPQGGSISPLLANLYLHYVLDLWFEKKIKPGQSEAAHLVRYADDFCLFFRRSNDMEQTKTLIKARLAQFGLTVAEEKTHSTHLGARPSGGTHERRRMTFLGFSIYRAKNRTKTGNKTVFKTDSKRFSRAKATMKARIRLVKHWPVKEQVKMINAVLRGHFNYYGIAGNGQRIVDLWHFTRQEWKHSLSKRSQKGRLDWKRFKALLDQHRLVPPTIGLSYSQLAGYSRL